MAIIFIKNISTTSWNNAYNNNVVTFFSNVPKIAAKCTITILGNVIEITPINNVFNYNFKSLVRIILDNSFIDPINYSNITTNDLSNLVVSVNYVITFADATTVQTTVVYPFLKRVQQIGEETLPALITPTVLNGNNIVFWEGFPFDIFCLNFTTPINITTSAGDVVSLSAPFTRVSFNALTSTQRFISQGFTIEPSCGIPVQLILAGFSILTIGATILNIEKRAACSSSQYVKWFNIENGCWSYWMFSPIFRDNLNVDTKTAYERDDASLAESQHIKFITGKNTEHERVLLAEDLNDREKSLLNTLLTSPKVELWKEGQFISVFLADGKFETTNTKKATHKMQITIKLKHYSY